MGYALAKLLRTGVEKRIRKHDPRSTFPQNEHPWSYSVEAHYPKIREEFERLLPQLDNITNFDDILPGLIHGSDWKSFYLIAANKKIQEHQLLCPETSGALTEIPGLLNAFFSIFQPGVEVRPHQGPYAGIIRYHLGVIIPAGEVGIKVDGITHRWEEGKSLLFDDRFTHEAWNKTDSIRVILFVDLVRPLPQPLASINLALLKIFKTSKAARNAMNVIANNQLRDPKHSTTT